MQSRTTPNSRSMLGAELLTHAACCLRSQRGRTHTEPHPPCSVATSPPSPRPCELMSVELIDVQPPRARPDPPTRSGRRPRQNEQQAGVHFVRDKRHRQPNHADVHQCTPIPAHPSRVPPSLPTLFTRQSALHATTHAPALQFADNANLDGMGFSPFGKVLGNGVRQLAARTTRQADATASIGC